jgi:hypothetical protein
MSVITPDVKAGEIPRTRPQTTRVPATCPLGHCRRVGDIGRLNLQILTDFIHRLPFRWPGSRASSKPLGWLGGARNCGVR